MFDRDGGADAGLGALLERFAGLVDDLQGLNLTGACDDSVLALLRELEVQKNRLSAVDHALIAEVEQRGLAAVRACAKPADLLVELLRIDARAATARVRAARELGPRRALSGQVLEAIFPTVAAASAAGTISPVHAHVVTATVDALPAAVAAEHDRAVEGFLTEQAEQFDPRALRLIARRLTDTLDPDGTLSTEADRARRRDFTLALRPDGSSQVAGELDAICTEAVLTVLDTLARPTPHDESGARDPRSPAQRRHDALRDAMLTLLRTDQLPACGGITTTILLTMTPEQFRSPSATSTGRSTGRSSDRRGRGDAAGGTLVLTGHGALISTHQAATLFGDAQLMPITLTRQKRVAAYGSTHRIFTANQRLAMSTRDHGCSFPGCTVPPAWCEAHHIIDYALGGPTSVENGTLLCGYHHREHPTLGWTCTMINGTPHWTPPPWLDPTQTPRRNHAHNPTAALTPETDPTPDLVPV